LVFEYQAVFYVLPIHDKSMTSDAVFGCASSVGFCFLWSFTAAPSTEGFR